MGDVTCAVPDCSKRRRKTVKWCSMHEARLRRRGTLDDGPFSHAPLGERFWRFVDRADGCWWWQGSINNKGYGQIGRGPGGGLAYAHRVSYELHVGPIPAGMKLLHSCDNPACVNPDHLSIGTQGDNMRDAAAKGRTLANERNPSARFSNETIREVRRRVAAGEMQKAVAADVGMSVDYVWRIVAQTSRRGI